MIEIYKDKDPSYYKHTRNELLPFLPQNLDTILDIGCGTGNFGLMLKELYNCKAWGIEPDNTSALEAKGKLDGVINADFDKNIQIPNNQKFDCIFFNDVLEHLADPEGALLLAGTLLKKDGQIIASIPNIRWYPVMLSLLRYKDFRYQNSGVMDKTHMRFFTAKSMVRLFEDAGYKVLKIQGINKDTGFIFFNILNFLLFNTQEDMKYPQFALVATKQTNAD
ncbi:MAG: class I SAM-dependent methyltransferase [Mucilaginibacter sp.]